MSKAPTSEEVLSLVAEWLEAKAKQRSKPTQTKVSGGFGLWGSAESYYTDGVELEDRDDGDEQPLMLEADKKLLRAQTALDLYVSGKIEEALQSLINQSNQLTQAERGHQLYPERG